MLKENRKLYILLALLLPLTLRAQVNWEPVRQKGNYFKVLESSVEPNNSYPFSNSFSFTAVTVRFQGSTENANLIIDDLVYPLVPDPHSNGDLTTLIHLNQAYNQLTLNSGNIQGQIELHLINGAHEGHRAGFDRRTGETESCDEPVGISQEVWRDGLELTNTSRAFSTVEHLIVHHSAGSNSASDYTEVVRSIFIYHTESNGWSDIGYNYLIAPDGSLFWGRDPIGGAQDNVIGAHFCGKNTGTMGICLMGTFTDVSPTDQALSTLRNLLSWKARKDGLNPIGSGIHSGEPLNTIAGHRDGCATECPGQMTYNLLPTLRYELKQTVDACNGIFPPVAFSIYPNPVSGNSIYINTPDEFEIVDIIDSQGRLARHHTIPVATDSLEIPIGSLPGGVYFVQLRNSFKSKVGKFVIKR